jgi:hypothetical protein
MFQQNHARAMQVPVPQAATHSTTVFEYVGRTALTVHGTVSRRVYRFERTGARVDVDSRDVVSLSAVPLLRRI